MVERHGNAHAIALGAGNALADVIGVEEQIAVRQHGAFGEAGGAGGVLNVDHIFDFGLGLPAGQVGSRDVRPPATELSPAQDARLFPLLDADHVAQLWTCCRVQRPG